LEELHELGGRDADKLRRLPVSLVLDNVLAFDDNTSAISLILRTTVNWFYNTHQNKAFIRIGMIYVAFSHFDIL